MSRIGLSLREFNKLFPDEEAARAWFECVRWPDGPECPGCGSVNGSTWLATVRRWNCRSCYRQYTVMGGTVMRKSHLPPLTWAQAIYLVASSSKGISAVKLGEMLGVSYKTAWFLGHRIREMMDAADTDWPDGGEQSVESHLPQMAEILRAGIGRSLSFDDLVRPA